MQRRRKHRLDSESNCQKPPLNTGARCGSLGDAAGTAGNANLFEGTKHRHRPVITNFDGRGMKRPVQIMLAGILLLGGCTANHYRRSADREAAAVIAEKTPRVPNMDPKFTIETNGPISLDGLPILEKPEPAFGPEATAEVGSYIVSLEKALELAVKHSRAYQAAKESLYLKALGLTLARRKLQPAMTPILNGKATANFQHKTAHQVQNEVDTVTEERRITASGRATMEMLLHTGARITASFTTDFLRFFTGNSRASQTSALAAELTQPLLKGAGYRIAIENLTQAERDLLYALRNFTRYRKEFAVEIATAYYGVLRSKDEVRNSWRYYQNLQANVEREQAFADEGQRPLAYLGQLKQALLNAESQWVQSTRNYFQNLDSFKIRLGLPVKTRVVLDDQELERLQILHPSVNVEEAVQVALACRLDLQNQRDEYEDALRRVQVAASMLKPRLDIVSGVSVPGADSAIRPAPDFKNYQWYAGVDAELPFDKKAERNAYRAALIEKEQAARALELATDNIRLQILEDWRTLDQAKRNYEIREIGVKLSEQRVEEETLKQELGRGTARDLVDAQTDLINSKNARTAALISHTLARLQFWRDMGILMIQTNGLWEETKDADVKAHN